MATVGPISQYDILRKLARGGMGEVYLARQTGIEGFAKEVVLKRIHANYAENPQFVKMFLQEARVAALLDHPNIVQIYELGKHGPDYFIVMEYVKGLSLSRLIKAAGGPIPHPFAIQVAAGVAAGLQFAHEKKDSEGRPINLVHRDISPPNVLLSTSGSVKITDFGIAKMRDSVTHTQVGVIKGKYSYISPEQARGEQATRQSDIYSLGLVLYEMATGIRAYPAGNDKEVLKAVSRGQLPPPELHVTNFPEDLRGVLMRALEPNVSERYSECQELQEDLLSLLVGRRIVTSPAKLGQYVEELTTKLEGEDVPSPRRNTLESIKMVNPLVQAATLDGLGGGASDPTADLQPDPPTARTPIQALSALLGPDSLVDLDQRDDPSISTENDEVSTVSGGSSFRQDPSTTRTLPIRDPAPLKGLPTSPDGPAAHTESGSPAERDQSVATVETPAVEPPALEPPALEPPVIQTAHEERGDPSQPHPPVQATSPVVEMPAEEPIGADDFDEDADTIMVDRSKHLSDELDSAEHGVQQELVLDPMAMEEADAASSREEPGHAENDEHTSAFDDKTEVSLDDHDMDLLGAMQPSSDVALEEVAAATGVDGAVPSAFEDHDSQQGPDPRVQELGPGSLTGATGEVQAGRKRTSSLPWIAAIGLVVVLGAGVTWFFGFKEATPEVGVNASTTPEKPPKKPPKKPAVRATTRLDAGTKVAVVAPAAADAAAAPVSVDAGAPDRGLKPDLPAPRPAVKQKTRHRRLSRRQRIRLARRRRARALRRKREAARKAREAARKSEQSKKSGGNLLLTLTTTPKAEVLYRGKRLGRTPLKAKIARPKGKLTLSFQNKAVGLNAKRTISRGGTHIATRFIFRKGILGIQVPAGSSVYLDGKSLGRAPIKPRLVYEGSHIVVVKRKGSRLMKTFRPKIRPAKTTWVNLE